MRRVALRATRASPGWQRGHRRQLCGKIVSRPASSFRCRHHFFYHRLPTRCSSNSTPALVVRDCCIRTSGCTLHIQLISRGIRISVAPSMGPITILSRCHSQFSRTCIAIGNPSINNAHCRIRHRVSAHVTTRLVGHNNSMVVGGQCSI